MTQKIHSLLCIIVLLAVIALPGQLEATTADTKIDQWLALGPMPIPNAEVSLLGTEKNILKFNHLPVDTLKSISSTPIEWPGKLKFTWHPIQSLKFQASSHQILYLATYIETKRWLQTDLHLQNIDTPFIVYLDGAAQKTSKTEKGESWKSQLTLTNGKHSLIIKILLQKDKPVDASAILRTKETFGENVIAISLNSTAPLSTHHILNTHGVSNLALSPDGEKVAMTVKQTSPINGSTKRWLEILSTATGKSIFSSQNLGNLKKFKWLKDSRHFSYTLSRKGKSSLFLYDIATHHQEILLTDIVNFNNYDWAPDNSYLIYSVYSKGEANGTFKHIDEIEGRASFSGYRYSLYQFFPQGKATHKISGGDLNFRTVKISPDSKRALLIKTVEDNRHRPYFKDVVYLLNTTDLSKNELFEHHFVGSLTWAPDSKRILVLGGPSAFDGIGKVLPKDMIPNDYDSQAFAFDIDTQDVTPLSISFDPSIESAYWHPLDNSIYFRVTEKANGNLFRFSTKRNRYTRLQTNVDVVRGLTFAREKALAVYWGSGVSNPHKLYKIDLKKGKASLLKDFNNQLFADVTLGRVKDWNFKTDNGKTVTGRIYFPPDFDESKRYPCIVNYYGGTSPVSRSFGGRYPRNWYAAQGYIVYVLQPTGTVGFGQEASSIHVNDWGKVTTGQIITGIKKLTEAHPYIDPKRIGAIGASYGGFLTQYLAASTDSVAAFISHAGISALSSYWGVGDWGYTYSAVATADSFPWNRKDIYVERSPLFMADRINNPLLLLHGSIDNNVPPGESYQMYAALKLLGKEVELITFDGEQHWILGYKKRLHWMRTIIAWFDKWLKDQPEHWEHLYGKK
jgi:dipeptidyl aminopeptidase/acylaminoacyl peptidase